MKPRLILLLILLMGTSIVFADDDPQTPWPIEERCVPDPTLPPDDWTYSGTLLMSGYAGIHAMQADWDTPRVEAFLSADALGYPLDGGQISPNGNWYAIPIGWVETERSLNKFWFTVGLRVYSLVDDTILDFKIEDYAEDLDYRYYNCCAWDYDTVQWLNDDALIFGGLLIRPFDEEVSLSPFFVGKYYYENRVFSPDVERVFYSFGYDTAGIYDPNDRDEVLAPISLVDGLSWQHDSNTLVVEHYIDSYSQNEADYLSLYDRDGNFIEQVFNKNTGSIDLDRPVSGRSEYAWSFDDRYFAFTFGERYATPTQLLILDVENQVTIDTCLSIVAQPVWSPDEQQVAFLLNSPSRLQVAILDVESWQVYVVATHSREITFIGNETILEPGMIGWRSNE